MICRCRQAKLTASLQPENSAMARVMVVLISFALMFALYPFLTSYTLLFTLQIWGPGYFDSIASHCKDVPPIFAETFIQRQDSLAQLLYSLNASAYVAEPGANAAYFANISSSHWHISERPLLLIVQPVVGRHGEVHANVSILTPYFEATRAKLLPVPSASKIAYQEWKEHEDPYKAVTTTLNNVENGKIFVDDAIRHFIVDGLQQASPSTTVVSAPVQIRRLRERKSKQEIEILKCANEVHSPVYVCPGLNCLI